MNKQHILLEYDKYTKKYKNKYGDNTIVLIQLGSFFEICASLDNDNLLGELNIHQICDDVLNIDVGNKYYKSGDEKKKYFMAGFPIVSKDKYFNYLLNHNYTIVLVEQVTEPPNPDREVTQILSPGTDIEYNKNNSNHLLSVYIEKLNNTITAGVSSIDLSTGKNYIHNINNINNDNQFCIDEISRFINFYNPSELIFQTHNYDLSRDDVINQWDINHDCFRIDHYLDEIYLKPSYQNELIQQIFIINKMLTPLQDLSIDRNEEMKLSYIYLLIYIREHKITILNNIERPVEQINDNYLTLTSNSIRQLNVVNNYSYYKGRNESLLSICNICLTSMGKREFKNRLLYPLLDVNKITKRYECIGDILKTNCYNDIRDNLKYINDLEKIIRLMSLQLLNPNKIASTNLSYEFVELVIRQIKEKDIFIYFNQYEKDIINFELYLIELRETFNFEIITNEPIEQMKRSIFKYGLFDKIDIVDKEIVLYSNRIDLICDKLSKFIDNKDTNSVKYFINKDNSEIQLYCTKPRAKKLKEKFKKKIVIKEDGITLFVIDPKEISYKNKDSANSIIELSIMSTISSELDKLYRRLSKLNQQIYNDTIIHLYENYKDTLMGINNIISDIDVSCAAAKLSVDNKYSKPEIIESDKSFMDIEGIRHPIVEKINQEYEYITNDIILGKEMDGMLLYGTNACGKSTFMKAVGLNLIMAQAGLYVACSKFKFMPYSQIFTRILNNDNIFKSQSSFAIEMEELRTIEQRSDNKSLVLGDELCSGTETISALSIVSAGLHILSKKNVSFIITTHLHQLTDIDIIKNIENLNIYHLKIININGKIFYDRKISSGSGPSIYGLNVCEAMGVSKEFIDIAYGVQKKLQNNSKKISRYNQDIVMDKCKICKETAEETHHIKEQNMADENGIIEHFHKNNKHNLVPLCKKCHDSITYGTLVITGYTQTSEGIELNYHTAKTPKSKKKFNDEDVIIIKTYKKYYDINISDCQKRLKLNNNISISLPILNKIMNDKY